MRAWLTLVPVLVSLASAQEPPGGHIVLDVNACWRQYYRFHVPSISAAVLKSEGEQALGKPRFDRLKRETETLLRDGGMDPQRVDWRDQVRLAQRGPREFLPTPAAMPAPDWAGNAFDDSTWVRDRGAFQGGTPLSITTPILGQYDENVDLRLQAAWHRTRFVVDGAPGAGDLSLRIVYAGGLRVFLNGREILRQHLPQGPLADDAAADVYPAGAYAAGATLWRRTAGPLSLSPQDLRQGVNVLAVEVRASPMHPVVLAGPIQPNWGGPQRPWPHARLAELELRSSSPAARPAMVRPPETQVWAEDMHHRVLSTDFLAPGEPPGTVVLVGPRNGIASAQVVVGTKSPLADLAVEVSDLAGPAGQRLPAAAVKLSGMLAYPADQWTLQRLGDERGLGATFPGAAQLARFAAGAAGTCSLYDRIEGPPPRSVAADTAQPLWLTAGIPALASPGVYRGHVQVSARNLAPVRLPVALEVVGWTLPDPRQFRTIVGCEQNPYAVARQYGVAPWSDAHVKRLEGSLRQLARIGNAWLNVPVLSRTEFGNMDDSMIRWTLRKDGTLVFDYGLLDRYLDLAREAGLAPRVIQFVVMHGMPNRVAPAAPQVRVFDEAAGTTRDFPVGPVASGAGREAWRSFATSLRAHMQGRGQEKAMYWGAPLEGENDPDLKTLLAGCTPDVFWTAGGHEIMSNAKYCRDNRFYRLITDIRYQGGCPFFRDDQGWKSEVLHLANPRVGGTCLALHTTSHPFAFRVLPGRALAMGRGGFTRVGADEWAAVHYAGMDTPQWITGLPVLFMLWPGPEGAESSARFEALLEGVQESEARIFIEQTLDRGELPAALRRKTEQRLASHFHATDFFQGNSLIGSMEKYDHGWQDRARQLYEAATEVAGQVKP